MVKIVADTTAGLSRETLKSLDIALIPQIVCFGEESYRDDTEIDTATFIQKLKASAALPKTAAPPPMLYYPIFEAAQKAGEEVVVVAPSTKVSGTVRSAESAAQDFPGLKVYVVDTLTLAGNLASLVLLAREWAGQGSSGEEIVRRLHEWIPRGRLLFILDTLEYLQKGGRIGGARALLGEILQIKPILCLREGQAEPFEQLRTKRRAVARLLEVTEEKCPRSPEAHLSVMQSQATQEAEALVAELKTKMSLPDIPIYEMPPAIVTHGGPGILAVGFFEA